MTNDKCRNCGGDRGIHHYQTDQCPIGGVESRGDRPQEYKTSTFEAVIPFDPPSRLARDMTIREHFAAMAMQGLLASDTKREAPEDSIAAWAVVQADALIADLNLNEHGINETEEAGRAECK